MSPVSKIIHCIQSKNVCDLMNVIYILIPQTFSVAIPLATTVNDKSIKKYNCKVYRYTNIIRVL